MNNNSSSSTNDDANNNKNSYCFLPLVLLAFALIVLLFKLGSTHYNSELHENRSIFTLPAIANTSKLSYSPKIDFPRIIMIQKDV